MENNKQRSCRRVSAAAKITLFSIGYLALAAASANEVHAQESPPAQALPANESPPPVLAPAQESPSTQPAMSSSPADTPAQQQPSTTALPQVTVEAPHSKPRSASPVHTSQLSAPPPIAPPPGAPDPSTAVQAAWPVSGTQDARTGTVGVYANSTSVATKINTPLVNIPQSLSVVTREFISDNSFQNLTDITRYVPGVDVHQGEGNRDELIIRGVDSSANFFVNGFRDDVQYFRDLQRPEHRGPGKARLLTFGRGAGGGVVNRTLKSADGQRIYEGTLTTGAYQDRRVTLDAGQAVNENVAVRLNTFYEGSDTFRDYGHLERYGFNPTVTLKPDDDVWLMRAGYRTTYRIPVVGWFKGL
jgi:catecholate siderophore receptor